jgi:sporulation protein YlmC with PRC-barrel domain
MILSELLQLPVLDAVGTRIGVVTDARFALDPDSGEARMLGLLVGRRSHEAFLGYERKSETAPALIARFLRWRARGSFLVLIDDVRSIEPDGVRLGTDYRRYSPALP